MFFNPPCPSVLAPLPPEILDLPLIIMSNLISCRILNWLVLFTVRGWGIKKCCNFKLHSESHMASMKSWNFKGDKLALAFIIKDQFIGKSLNFTQVTCIKASFGDFKVSYRARKNEESILASLPLINSVKTSSC